MPESSRDIVKLIFLYPCMKNHRRIADGVLKCSYVAEYVYILIRN